MNFFNNKYTDIKIVVVDSAVDIPLPNYETVGSVGMDLRANVPVGINGIPPMGRCLVKCGFKMELPDGYEAQIRPRSGLALKSGITVLNSPGTIDQDFRDEVGVILINLSNHPFYFTRGDRIAQMVISKVEIGKLIPVMELSTTIRGNGGFGHSGNK